MENVGVVWAALAGGLGGKQMAHREQLVGVVAKVAEAPLQVWCRWRRQLVRGEAAEAASGGGEEARDQQGESITSPLLGADNHRGT